MLWGILMSEMIKIPDGWHQLSIDALWEECWSGEWGNEPSTYNVCIVTGKQIGRAHV